jgi:uncharacterized protein with GYD domain
MPKYLVQGNYTADGVKGLRTDKAAGRVEMLKHAVEHLGGKLEAFYWTFGEHDAVAIIDAPDNVKAAALSMAAASSGHLRLSTTPLMTAQEVDQALAEEVSYRLGGLGRR